MDRDSLGDNREIIGEEVENMVLSLSH